MPSFILSCGLPGQGLRDVLRGCCYEGCRLEFAQPAYEEDGVVVCPGPKTVDVKVVQEVPHYVRTERGGGYIAYPERDLGYFLDGHFFKPENALKRIKLLLGEGAEEYLKLLPVLCAVG